MIIEESGKGLAASALNMRGGWQAQMELLWLWNWVLKAQVWALTLTLRVFLPLTRFDLDIIDNAVVVTDCLVDCPKLNDLLGGFFGYSFSAVSLGRAEVSLSWKVLKQVMPTLS